MKAVYFSILLSLACILAALINNYFMALDYETVSGKTQAFYGAVHWQRFYYAVLGVAGFLFAVLGWLKKENSILLIIAFVLAVGSILLTFSELWRLMV